MSLRLARTVLAAACALVPVIPMLGGAAHAQLTAPPVNQPVGAAQTIDLSIGRGELVTLPAAISDIFVASQGIADVQVKSTHQLFVFGIAGGETTIYASNPSGDVVWSANVRVGTNLSSVDQMLKLAMPEAKISVATMSANTVLLTGTVAAPEDAAEAERLAQAFMGPDALIVSRLKTATPLQVMLRVRFAEVSRSLVRALGSNLVTRDETGGFTFGLSRGDAGSITTDSQGTAYEFATKEDSTTLGLAGNILGLDLLGTLDAGETMGLVTTLSEPNLTALSGETAEFLAGGEFPIPLSQGLGTTTIEYKNYGVSLAYTPTVLASGRISIRVRPEVSELSSQNAVVIDGYQIPALTIRRAETTVELGSGQSFMIAGLLSNNATSTIDKTPGAGDIPILGNLFRSSDFRRGETELVIVVTPYLVTPVHDREIRLPTDGYAVPSMAEQLLLNRESGATSGASRPLPQAAAPIHDAIGMGSPVAGDPATPATVEGQ